MTLRMDSDQIAAVVDEIRRKVRARYQKQVDGLPDFCLPSLSPLGQARDAAEGKAASIGIVNPRPPGPISSLIQGIKKLVSRSLAWHVREQVEFNRAVIRYMDQTLAALDEHNRNLLLLAQMEQQHREAAAQFEAWQHWRAGWEEKLAKTEVQFLRTVAELQGAFQHRVSLLESNFREHLQAQHADYLGALDRTTLAIQKQLFDDLGRLRMEQERQIHTELRLIRQRVVSASSAGTMAPALPPVARPPAAFDYARFAERFRGSPEYVAAGQRFYLPHFQGRRQVLDLGCGRGEFLELMREGGIPARGVDSDADSVSLCRQKGLDVVEADLFAYLAALDEESLDGVFSAQVVEHLPPERVPELVALAARTLERGGLLAIETPNPDCLAIFATNFYLDPTHVRPAPSAQLHFYFEESGFGGIEVHPLAPAADLFPEIAALASIDSLAAFQKKFFGGLDYVILGRKL